MAVAAIGLLLRLFPPGHYAIYPACPLHSLTGLECPACGSTRAIAALLAGRWTDAWHYNPLAVLLAPCLAAFLLLQLYSALRYDRWRPVPYPPLAARAILAVALLFGVLRNVVR